LLAGGRTAWLRLPAQWTVSPELGAFAHSKVSVARAEPPRPVLPELQASAERRAASPIVLADVLSACVLAAVCWARVPGAVLSALVLAHVTKSAGSGSPAR